MYGVLESKIVYCHVLLNESWIGSQFEGRVVGRTAVGGLPAIITLQKCKMQNRQ